MGSSAASTTGAKVEQARRGAATLSGSEAPAPLVDDWEGKELPKFTQPSRPHNEGLKALETLVLNPKAKPDRVLMETEHVVVAYDCFRKAKVHVLLLPKDPTLHGPDDLRPSTRRFLNTWSGLPSGCRRDCVRNSRVFLRFDVASMLCRACGTFTSTSSLSTLTRLTSSQGTGSSSTASTECRLGGGRSSSRRTGRCMLISRRRWRG